MIDDLPVVVAAVVRHPNQAGRGRRGGRTSVVADLVLVGAQLRERDPPAELDRGLAQAACGVTSNPVLTYRALTAHPSTWRERIVNLERMYNVRQGMSRADDTLPQRFSQEPAPLYDYDLDPETGQVTASPEPIRYGQIHSLEAMLDRYYYLRQWDNQGKPTKEVLARLNLLEITKDVEDIQDKAVR